MVDTQEQPTDETTERRRPIWPLISVVIVATLLAVWLVPENPQAPPEAPREAAPTEAEPGDAQPAPSGEAPLATETQGPTEEPSVPQTVPTPPPAEGDHAREFIARQRNSSAPDLPAAYSEAEGLRAAGRQTDAWLIHFYAARQGYAPSALVLGTLSDPSYHEAGMGALEGADPAQALKWYGMAADAGDTEAARRLQNLRARIEESAAAGDPEAELLMLQWR